MKTGKLNFEILIYIFALALAFGIRFFNLGNSPLSDAEAVWALQARELSQVAEYGKNIQIGPYPGYVLLTGLLFSVFENTNFLARFWPALAGSLLVMLPYLFIHGLDQQGKQPAEKKSRHRPRITHSTVSKNEWHFRQTLKSN